MITTDAGSFIAVAARVGRSVVRVQPLTGRRAGTGAGVAWGGAGLVITNAHVATGERLAVAGPDERPVPARMVRRDPDRDLAVLEAPDLHLPSVELADPRGARPGSLVCAIGHPLGVANALSVGVLQAVGPAPALPALPHRSAALDWVQADVRLAPGNSGGPMVDAEGRVLGLSTMIVAGLALGVPGPDVEALARAATRPRLGVVCEPAPAGGLRVTEVGSGSVAAGAGIRAGDVLVAASGTPLRSIADLSRALGAGWRDGWLTLDLVRSAKWERRQIALGQADAA
jgi:serine protease Do